MKKILYATVAMLAASSLNAAEMKLSYTHQASMESEIHVAAWTLKNYLADGGLIDAKLYANNQLGQEREVYEGMQLGSGADCIISGTAILGNFSKKVGVLDLPFLWKDYDMVHTVLDGEVGDLLAEELKGSGFTVIDFMDSWGYRNVVTAGKPVNAPEDLKGLKLRTIPTDTYVAAVNAMGANATPMAFGEVYTAMETGVLDGLEHGASVVLANKFYEVADHMALTKHLFGPLVFACSNSFISSLSKEELAALEEASAFARDVQRALAPVREAEALDQLRAKGMTITEIDVTPLREAAKPVQDELAAAAGASDLLAKIRDGGM